MEKRQAIAKAKAIEQKNKKRLLAVNPQLDEKIRNYFLKIDWRNENVI